VTRDTNIVLHVTTAVGVRDRLTR